MTEKKSDKKGEKGGRDKKSKKRYLQSKEDVVD